MCAVDRVPCWECATHDALPRSPALPLLLPATATPACNCQPQECDSAKGCLGTALSAADAALLPNNQWVSKEVDLTPYKGNSIKVVFRVRSFEEVYSGYDNIQVITTA